MDIRIEKLIAAFESNGWVYKGPVDMSDWWFADILQLTSTWRPVNIELYLTLLTDPQIPHKKIVWAIGISSQIPARDNLNFIDQLTLTDINKVPLKELVAKVNDAVLR